MSRNRNKNTEEYSSASDDMENFIDDNTYGDGNDALNTEEYKDLIHSLRQPKLQLNPDLSLAQRELAPAIIPDHITTEEEWVIWRLQHGLVPGMTLREYLEQTSQQNKN